MNVKIIKNKSEEELQKQINKTIKELYSHSAMDRDFTIVKDIKFTCNADGFSALIIFDDARSY